MAEITGKHWAFIMVNVANQLKVMCPAMVKLEEVYFDVEVSGLKRNFYDNAIFNSKEEAIDAMIAQLEAMKNG